MASSILPIDSETLTLSNDAAKAAATPYAQAYQSAQPYAYGCIENFLPPDILERVRAELDELPEAQTSFDRAQERLKTSYVPERLPPYTRNLFYVLNSKPFLMFLEELTGINGLIPDPYFLGGWDT